MANSQTTAFLQVHGLQVDAGGLDRLVAEVVSSFTAGLFPVDPKTDLTPTEVDVLRAGGLDVDPVFLAEEDPLSGTVATFVALLQTSMMVREVATMLDVTPGRVRQMLTAAPRSLFGIRLQAGWRIPTFQFTDGLILPDWPSVLRVLDQSIHPVTLARWVSRPNPDLVDGEHPPMSPRDWLATGRPVDEVVDLARHL